MNQDSSPAHPSEVLEGFVSSLGRGDLAAAIDAFTREACLLTPDGTAVHGHRKIGGVLAQMTAAGTGIAVEQVTIRQAGKVALAGGIWSVTQGPDAARFTRLLRPVGVLHFVEARWKIAILDPWLSP